MTGTVDAFLAQLESEERAAFALVIEVVARLAPEAEQGMSYGVPAFLIRGRPLLGMQSSREHLALYPFSPAAIEAAAAQLEGFRLSKGTIRFTASTPLPQLALEQVVAHRLAELDG